jgi:hypothetical protein
MKEPVEVTHIERRWHRCGGEPCHEPRNCRLASPQVQEANRRRAQGGSFEQSQKLFVQKKGLPAVPTVAAVSTISTTSTTTASAIAATATAVTATVSVTTAAEAFGLRPRFVNHQVPTPKVLTVEGSNRTVRFFIVRNLDEAETAGLSRKAVAN